MAEKTDAEVEAQAKRVAVKALDVLEAILDGRSTLLIARRQLNSAESETRITVTPASRPADFV